MKILKFVAENLKRLKIVEITPKGHVVEISGANGAGKSSVLDAVYWTLGGNKNVQKQPISHGASEGRTELDLGDYLVKKRFSKSGATLVVERKADGVRIGKPQEFLDGLCGKGIGFDPLAFSRMKAKDQFETLRKLVKVEVDIDKLDQLNRSDFEKRAEFNREVKSLSGQADGITYPPETPDAGIAISELSKKVEDAAVHNGEITNEKARRISEQRKIDAEVAAITTNLETIKSIDADIRKLQERIAELNNNSEIRQSNIVTMKVALAAKPPIPDPIDVSQVREQVTFAVAVNSNVTKKAQKKAVLEKLAAAEKASKDLTEAMEGREETKRAAIAAAKFPVDGLGFGSDEVLLAGVPFEQASSAEQLRASCAIAMAMNPELRLIIIRDGSLLDDKSMGILADLAKGNDYQVWAEVVDTSGTVGVVLEDGMVVADNQKSDQQPS